MILKIKSPNVVLKTKDKYLTEDIQILVDESVVNGEVSTLKILLDATKKSSYLFSSYEGKSIDHLISYNDTENVTDFSFMYQSSNIETYPIINTIKGIRFDSIFASSEGVIFPAINVSNGTTFSRSYDYCYEAKSILMYGMKVNFSISNCYKLEAEALVTILSNCQVVTTSPTLTMGSKLLPKLDGVYVKETGVEQYEGITCRPCVICESTNEGAMTVQEYATLKGWTLA